MVAGQAEPALEQLAQPWLDAAERCVQLLGTEGLRDDGVGLVGLLILDEVAVQAVPACNREPRG